MSSWIPRCRQFVSGMAEVCCGSFGPKTIGCPSGIGSLSWLATTSALRRASHAALAARISSRRASSCSLSTARAKSRCVWSACGKGVSDSVGPGSAVDLFVGWDAPRLFSGCDRVSSAPTGSRWAGGGAFGCLGILAFGVGRSWSGASATTNGSYFLP